MNFAFGKNGFTLLELIIVIIIVGILATVGLNQYNNIIEKGRAREARTNIGYMRKLTQEYYLKNSTLDGMALSDIGVGSSSSQLPSSCSNSNYYFRYGIGANYSSWLYLYGVRCTSGGKSPNAERAYNINIDYRLTTGATTWVCYYVDDTSVGCPF
jgi:prepilin-type N-terminal cleavage/methylation domain-containing protein